MKFLKLAALLAVGLLPIAAHAANICPTTSSTNSDCAFILNIGAGGAVTGTAVPGAGPYDNTAANGGDDALVGIVNNSGAIFSGTIHLTGSGDGGGIFEFDGDGICSYDSASYCSTAATGYEGPDVTFANITSGYTVGDVVVSALGIGESTYFSLESSPSSISGGGGIGVPAGSAPEPGSLILLGTGVAGIAGSLRRRFLKA